MEQSSSSTRRDRNQDRFPVIFDDQKPSKYYKLLAKKLKKHDQKIYKKDGEMFNRLRHNKVVKLLLIHDFSFEFSKYLHEEYEDCDPELWKCFLKD